MNVLNKTTSRITAIRKFSVSIYLPRRQSTTRCLAGNSKYKHNELILHFKQQCTEGSRKQPDYSASGEKCLRRHQGSREDCAQLFGCNDISLHIFTNLCLAVKLWPSLSGRISVISGRSLKIKHVYAVLNIFCVTILSSVCNKAIVKFKESSDQLECKIKLCIAIT